MNRKNFNLKSALASSIEAEEKVVDDRFSKAKDFFQEKKPAVALPPQKKQETAKPPTPKPKIVRQERVMAKTFTLPSSDYDLIDTIKKKCFLFGANPNQSEIVRAGLQSLNKLQEAELERAVNTIKKMKVGKPAHAK